MLNIQNETTATGFNEEGSYTIQATVFHRDPYATNFVQSNPMLEDLWENCKIHTDIKQGIDIMDKFLKDARNGDVDYDSEEFATAMAIACRVMAKANVQYFYDLATIMYYYMEALDESRKGDFMDVISEVSKQETAKVIQKINSAMSNDTETESEPATEPENAVENVDATNDDAAEEDKAE